MKQNIKELWVKALTSGEFTQGTGQLRDGNTYCCLGVLCELHRKATNSCSWDERDIYTSDHYSNGDVLPEPVMEWAGLDQSDPDVGEGWETLSGINDDGVAFPEIAEIIKRDL